MLVARGNAVDPLDLDALPEDPSAYELAIVQYREGDETVEELRRAAPKLHILTILASLDSRHIEGCISQGADDFMALRASASEVVARVGLPERLSDRYDQPQAMSDLIAISDAPRQLSQEIGDMFGLSMTNEPPSGAPTTTGAALRVTAAETGTEIDLMVGMTTESADTLTQMLFGKTVAPAVLQDCLREIANTAGGALKRAALGEGVTFTLGIPNDQAPDFSTCDTHFVATGGGIAIHVGMMEAQSENCQVRSTLLEPGMVLRHEVRSASGQLMVAAGTALTARTAERLLELCGPNAVFDVIPNREKESAA